MGRLPSFLKMNRTATVLLCMIVCSLASAQSAPILPMILDGKVLVDGVEAPAGTVVAAFVGGREASSHTLKEAGDYALAINGVKEDEGKKLSFTVDGRQVSGIEMTWRSGAVESRTLSVVKKTTTVAETGGSFAVAEAGSSGGGTGVYWALGLGLIVLIAAVFFVSSRKQKA